MEEKTLLTSEGRRGVARKFSALPKLVLLSVTLLVAVSTWIIVFFKPLGGDISPIRVVQDPYPGFYEVASDSLTIKTLSVDDAKAPIN